MVSCVMKEEDIRDVIDKDVIFIDVRAPIEFKVDHIPGAINLPVLDDEERKIVGIAYNKNQENALDIGIKFYEKKLPKLTKFINSLEKKKIVIYCWRGGLRSKIFTEFVASLDYDACRLKGGYKKYRAYVREELEKIKVNFIILYGLAGAGKTELIRKLNNSLDLEGLAQHRGSVFGAMGLKPRSQKMFETLLLQRLKELDNLVFVEGESRKIGDTHIPDNIFNLMKNAILVKINCPIKNRAKQIEKDYFMNPDKELLKKIIISLKQKIGKKMMNELLDLVDNQNYAELAKRILKDYYDGVYQYTFDKLDFQYEVNSEDIDKCAEDLERIRTTLSMVDA